MKKTLAVILVIAVLLLGAAFGFDAIGRVRVQKEHIWLMQTLLPEADDFELIPYEGEDQNIKSVHKASNGYVIETVRKGYADDIRMFIGVNNDGIVTGLVVLEANETVGIGNKILTDHKFLSQFYHFEYGKPVSGTFAIGETDGDKISVDGISGATVSSNAVVACVNSAVAYVTGADIDSSATTDWEG